MPQNPSNFAMARIAPGNRTGTGGEDLLSNNFNWNWPLVGLKGRGLDLGLTLSYNSLVWTRSGNYVDFDIDDGSIAPGFRLGFPTVEGPFYNDQAGQNFYLLVTPSGTRVELRYTGITGIYESKDSAHLQLIENGGSLLVRPTDGTRLNFVSEGGSWRCNQIKDRNGNYITVTYNGGADIANITDTLGRVLTFNYDGNDNLLTITQAGKALPWATFVWGTASIGNNFPSLTNLGPVSTSIAVLTQVGLADGSRFNFEYNNSYGMVSTIRHHAYDNRQRNNTTYIAPASADLIPRVTQRKDWAEFWTGVNGVPTEVVTTYAHDGDGACRLTAPDGTIHKEYYGSSWQSGLTIQSEVWSGGEKKKWTTIAWTQDNTAVSYLTNPRVMETNVYDAGGNRRRTTIDYGQYASYGLPNGVFEYQADGVSLLRVTYTDYNLNQAYLDRHIIGLVSAVHVSDGQWQSKTTYEYDTTAIDPQATAATMHDQNYHASFTARGNVTSVSRWDVTDIGNSNKRHTSTVTYNAAGSALSSTDPGIHTNTITYADSFSDGINRNTFAYPATVTDADNFSSTMQYNFESGAVTRTQGPPPSGQPQGAIQTMLYDSAGRIERVTTQNNGAYTRYVYGAFWVQSFSTVNTIADEAYSITVFDGVGRPFGMAGNHPGSVGGYRLAVTIYDQMGRASSFTRPFEVNNSWTATGDDAGGVSPTAQTYDWKGRPLVTTNTDGTQKYASYGGCGCAGGEVVTLTDEVGRQQKAYSDVVGRQWKSELLNWNGTVYSTTTNTFNARDQVTLVRQWAGAENGGGSYQDTTMSYDGYGRLQAKHAPEQNSGTATVYVYNADDTVQSVTDARGAYSTLTYNNRHLVTQVSYTPAGGVPDTPDVSFQYDAAGNRTLMTDGLGSVSYAYNQLSRTTSETRTFTGLGNYTVGYDYNLAGQLKSITDPAGATINYGFDSGGRLSAVTGSSFGGVTTYASNLQYRAWGSVKHLNYGNNLTLDAGYNSRLQATSFVIPNVLNKTYQYQNDGALSYSHDLIDQRFDRSYSFDHAARMTQAFSGAEARGEPATNDRPYKETFSYDAFNHLTSQNTNHWTTFASSSDAYSNNRRPGWLYDGDGRLLNNYQQTYAYDSAGQMVTVQSETITAQSFDGNGSRVKTVETAYPESGPVTTTMYYVRSSVLGGEVLTELNETGGKKRTFVYSGSQVFAWQEIIPFYGTQGVQWEHRDPSDASFRTSNVYGYVNDGTDHNPAELDPLGADSGIANPYLIDPNPPPEDAGLLSHPGFGDLSYLSGRCRLDGIPYPCADLQNRMDTGAAGYEDPLIWESTTSGRRPFFRPIRSFGLGLFLMRTVTRIDDALKFHDRVLYLAPQNTRQSDFTSDERQMATLAISQAIDALRSLNSECRAFFVSRGLMSLEDPADVLENIRDNGGIIRGSRNHRGDIAETWPALGSQSTIYLYNPFFTSTVGNTLNQIKGHRMSAAQARSLTILHELAHAVWRNFHGLLPFQMSSEELDENLFKKCLKSGQKPLPRGVTE